MKSQEKIMALLHARSEQAIHELSKVYGSLCRTIAGRILSSPEDVEETLNDVYLKVWNAIPPDAPRSLSAYIGTVTHNAAVSRLRLHSAAMRDDRLGVCLSELELCLPHPDTPETILERKRITQGINEFLSSCSKTNRLIFLRRYYCMDSTKEIAVLTGLSDQSVRSRLLRMRAQLREKLEKEGVTI